MDAILATICYLCIAKRIKIMQIVSAREFRSNQTAILKKALNGESILINSRIGTFKIVPVTDEDSLTTRISKGLDEVKLIKDGKLPRRTIQDMLDEI